MASGSCKIDLIGELKRAAATSVLVAACYLALTPAQTDAASDGLIGPNSTGTMEIAVSIPQLIRFTGVESLDFLTLSGESLSLHKRDICLQVALPSSTYLITASGSGANGSFAIQGTGDLEIPYGIKLGERSSLSGDRWLRPNQPVHTYRAASSINCLIGKGPDLQLVIPQSIQSLDRSIPLQGSIQLILEPS